MATYDKSECPQLTAKVEGGIIAAMMDTFKGNRNFEVRDVTGSPADPLYHLKTNHIGGIGESNQAGTPVLYLIMDKHGGIITDEYCKPNVYHPHKLPKNLPKSSDVDSVIKISFKEDIASSGADFGKYTYEVGVNGELKGFITSMYLIILKKAACEKHIDDADVKSCATKMGSYFLQALVFQAQKKKCESVEFGSGDGFTNDFFFLFKYMLFQLLKKNSTFKHWLANMSTYSVQIMRNKIGDESIDSVNRTLADNIDNLVTLAHNDCGNETVAYHLNRGVTDDQMHITYHPLIIWSLLASALQSDKMPELARKQSYVVDSIVTTTTSCSSQSKSSQYIVGPYIELPVGLCDIGFRGF